MQQFTPFIRFEPKAKHKLESKQLYVILAGRIGINSIRQLFTSRFKAQALTSTANINYIIFAFVAPIFVFLVSVMLVVFILVVVIIGVVLGITD